MSPPLKPDVTLAQPGGPVIATERLILRPWRGADIAANTAMLSDPATARFITADGKAVTEELVGWRNAAIMAGHWALHGYGMFVVEEKQSGRFVGRVGPWFPPGWPGFEVGWGIAGAFRGKGYATEAARAAIDCRSRPSSLRRSCIASTAKTRPPRPWRAGSVPRRDAGSTCSVTPPTSG
jgi:RimJ/RimL family protein N-acetyltransferase